ncbi:MAG: hypothetical protein PHS86_01945 [Syntrophaceae bacterium]|nr:hypothetical protein [Syntrophaceae bacterium]
MPTPTVINKYRFSDVINRRYWDKYWFDNFQLQPISAAVGGGAATGTAGDNNVLYTAFGQYEWNVIGTQTILAPKLDAFGLNLVQDATSGDGIELCMGRTALCPIGFTIGQDNAFFMQYKTKIEDASGCDPLGIGFLKAQAFNATLASYTDFAFIGIVGTAGHIQTITNLNGGSAVTTDTTDVVSDGATFQVQINVSSTGVVTYQYNYEEPTVVAAFQFDSGDFVVPFIRFTQGTDVTTQASSNYLEVGFQS